MPSFSSNRRYRAWTVFRDRLRQWRYHQLLQETKDIHVDRRLGRSLSLTDGVIVVGMQCHRRTLFANRHEVVLLGLIHGDAASER